MNSTSSAKNGRSFYLAVLQCDQGFIGLLQLELLHRFLRHRRADSVRGVIHGVHSVHVYLVAASALAAGIDP